MLESASPVDAPQPGLAAWFKSEGGRWRDPAARMRAVDVLAAAVAAILPWSTSGVAIVMVLWFIALLPTLDFRALLRSMARPASALPLAFFALAVIGLLWADTSWPARLHGINPVAKLLVIPFLLYHFARSQRGVWVFIAFLASCTLLMALSWIVAFVPLTPTSKLAPGVPVKDYIDQSQEFALCMFALAPLAVKFFTQRRFVLVAGCLALMLAFFANMMFVVSARTALVYMPVLLVLFAVLYLNARATVGLLAVGLLTAVIVWFSSPYLRQRVEAVGNEYRVAQQNEVSSTGLRLQYWSKSLKFFSQAPLFGHGTGSTKQLFEQDAVGKTGLAAEVIGNPHNQTLNVAVQWGLFGCIILYAMWISQLLLVRGMSLPSWIGLLVVVQNMVSSLLNSHLFDFHEGWMYVLGVGVAGGMVLGQRQRIDAS
jgi:O-antigen ligase